MIRLYIAFVLGIFIRPIFSADDTQNVLLQAVEVRGQQAFITHRANDFKIIEERELPFIPDHILHTKNGDLIACKHSQSQTLLFHYPQQKEEHTLSFDQGEFSRKPLFSHDQKYIIFQESSMAHKVMVYNLDGKTLSGPFYPGQSLIHADLIAGRLIYTSFESDFRKGEIQAIKVHSNEKETLTFENITSALKIIGLDEDHVLISGYNNSSNKESSLSLSITNLKTRELNYKSPANFLPLAYQHESDHLFILGINNFNGLSLLRLNKDKFDIEELWRKIGLQLTLFTASISKDGENIAVIGKKPGIHNLLFLEIYKSEQTDSIVLESGFPYLHSLCWRDSKLYFIAGQHEPVGSLYCYDPAGNILTKLLDKKFLSYAFQKK